MIRVSCQRTFSSILLARRIRPSLQSSSITRALSNPREVLRVPPGPPRKPTDYKHFRHRHSGTKSNGPRNVGLAVALLSGGYYVAHLERVPYTNRRRMIDVTRKKEIALGEATFSQLLASYPGMVLPEWHPYAQRVRAIGVRIARAVKSDRPELLEGFKWRFVVVDAPGVVNAACAPGGKIVVFSGLLDAAPNDDALAAVLAHEISHAILRHSAERLSFMKIIFMLQVALYVIVDLGGITNTLVTLVMDLPYSRKLEREADIVGLRLMTNACYDPAESPRMFQRLANIQQMSTGKENRAAEILSTHPMFSNRIKQLEKDVAEQQERYRTKCSPYSSFTMSSKRW